MPYQDASDLRLLPEMARLARPEAEAFLACDKAAGRSDGVIAPKYRELIALAVALTTQCAYCLDVHTGRALEAGATREELAETAFIAASLRAGAALGHGLMMLAAGRAGRTGGPVGPRVVIFAEDVTFYVIAAAAFAARADPA